MVMVRFCLSTTTPVDSFGVSFASLSLSPASPVERHMAARASVHKLSRDQSSANMGQTPWRYCHLRLAHSLLPDAHDDRRLARQRPLQIASRDIQAAPLHDPSAIDPPRVLDRPIVARGELP